MRVILISFATPLFQQSQQALIRTAEAYGCFSDIRTYGASDVEILKTMHPDIMSETRGYGLWLWKSYLVKQVMLELRDGDVLFYMDSGALFVNDPRHLLDLTEQEEIVLFELDFLEKDWTHRRAFDRICGPNHAALNSHMRLASYFLLKAGPAARSFASDWFALSSEKELLNDDFFCSPPPSFRRHRHDQSILSCLSKSIKYEVRAFRDPSQYGNKYIDGNSSDKYPQIIDHHRHSKHKLLYRLISECRTLSYKLLRKLKR